MKTKKENEARRERDNLATKNMSDSYIRKLIKAGGILKGCDIPQEIIEATRARLQLVRAIRELASAIKERKRAGARTRKRIVPPAIK